MSAEFVLGYDFFEPRIPHERKKKHRHKPKQQCNLELKSVIPKTENQKKVFKSYNASKNLLLHGTAGTGKTFAALFLSLDEILDSKSKRNKIYIVRSAEPAKSVGFLPGNLKEKVAVYEAPYISICSELFGRADAYEILKQKGIIEFISTSYLRGLTLTNAILIVDEVQNLEWNELLAVITRVGDNSRVILSGDYKQSDLKNVGISKRREDILTFMKIINEMSCFESIEFNSNDIVRSGIVREFIQTAERLGVM